MVVIFELLKMKLFYYKSAQGNFGDGLNPWIWEALAPELFDDDASTIFLGIGTLINSNVPVAPAKVVFGTGVGYMHPAKIDERWQFQCVRGPLSAQALRLDMSLAITDPAILLTEVVRSPVTTHGGVCYMPHHASLECTDWANICEKAGLVFLDPTADMHKTVDLIRGARLIIAEAMHGAIVADAFRVPWIPVVAYDHILGFKWHDWCQSLELDYCPHYLESVWDTDRHLSLERLAKEKLKRGLKKAGIWSKGWTPPNPGPNRHRVEGTVVERLMALASSGRQFLSSDKRHYEVTERLLEKLCGLKNARSGTRSSAPLFRSPLMRDQHSNFTRADTRG